MGLLFTLHPREKAIRSLKLRGTAGPDGLTIEICKDDGSV